MNMAINCIYRGERFRGLIVGTLGSQNGQLDPFPTGKARESPRDPYDRGWKDRVNRDQLHGAAYRASEASTASTG